MVNNIPEINAKTDGKRWLSVILMALFLSASTALAQTGWKAPPEAEKTTNPEKSTALSITVGKDLYEKYCAVCHGIKGDGQGPSRRAVSIPPTDFHNKGVKSQSDGSMAWKIIKGRGPMPTWEPVLSDKDIWNIINYIRSLTK